MFTVYRKMMSLRRGGKPTPIKEGEDDRKGKVTPNKIKSNPGLFILYIYILKLQYCAFETENRKAQTEERQTKKKGRVVT